jgi:predicted dehydrogenase
MNKINWGILSTGTIANKFAATISRLDDAGRVLAVASRSREKAAAFAAEHGVPRAYGDYGDLVRDKDIDVVYVATPHSHHYENARLCLEYGKHVLCEKSFTVNAAQAAELIALAREKRLFIMEAFWTKFLPAYGLLAGELAGGAVGEVTHFRAQYGFAPTGARYVRKFDPALAGGALLDIGVYALGVAAMVLGYRPAALYSRAVMGEYGTDMFDSMMLEYDSGATAHLITTIGSVIPTEAAIFGTQGRIVLPEFTALQEFTVVSGGGERTVKAPFEVNGFEYQIRETERCLRAGLSESPAMTHEQTLAVMGLMDTARAQWRLRFPCED